MTPEEKAVIEACITAWFGTKPVPKPTDEPTKPKNEKQLILEKIIR